MNLELIVVIIAAVAVVGLVGLSLTVGDAPVARKPSEPQRHGPFEGAMDVIDRSIGMYLVRRLTGRPTTRPADPVGPTPPLTTAEVAYRIGVAGAPSPSNAATVEAVDPGPGAYRAPMGSRASATQAPGRQRLVRDAGIALIGLSVLGVVAFLVLPQGGTTVKPAGSIFSVSRASIPPKASPAGSVLAAVDPTSTPTVIGLAEAFYAHTVGSTTMNARISWSGTDAGTGIARYEVQVSVNGGTFASTSLVTATSTSINRTLTDEKSYRFRVRATDKQGNVSAWVNGPALRPGRIQNTSTGVTYTGPWATISTSSALGGSHRYASSLSARASITRIVRDFGFVATRSPRSGSAQVWIDGVLAATIDLRSTSTKYRQLVFSRHFSTLGSHKLEIRPIGGGRVYLDAFLFYR